MFDYEFNIESNNANRAASLPSVGNLRAESSLWQILSAFEMVKLRSLNDFSARTFNRGEREAQIYERRARSTSKT